MTNYATNYANKSSIFDNGDVIEGHHVKSIYDELGEMPGKIASAVAPAVNGYYYSSASTVSATNSDPSQNRQYFTPLYIAESGYEVTELSVYVTYNASSTTLIAGIYGSADGRPDGSLLASKVTFDTSGTNSARTAATSVPLDRGLYWISCLTTNSNPASVAYITSSSVPIALRTPSSDTCVGYYLDSKTDLLDVSSANSFLQAGPTSIAPLVMAKIEIV